MGHDLYPNSIFLWLSISTLSDAQSGGDSIFYANISSLVLATSFDARQLKRVRRVFLVL
jgi:hypothetical protein